MIFDIFGERYCLVCGKRFMPKQTRSRFCSSQCSIFFSNNDTNCKIDRQKFMKDYYLKNKVQIKKKTKEYNEHRHEQKYSNWRKQYHNNKPKQFSRVYTNAFIRHHPNELSKICKRCGTEKSLEFHHEIYPTNVKEIREAIKNKQIYYLCKSCHPKGAPTKNYLWGNIKIFI